MFHFTSAVYQEQARVCALLALLRCLVIEKIKTVADMIKPQELNSYIGLDQPS